MRREWIYWLRDGGDGKRGRTTETERAWQSTKKERRKWKNWVTSILLAPYPSWTRSTPTPAPPSQKLLRIGVERSIEKGGTSLQALSHLAAASHENSCESDRLKELLVAVFQMMGTGHHVWSLTTKGNNNGRPFSPIKTLTSCKGSSRPSYTISVCANRRDRKFPIRYRQCYCGNPCCYHNAISHLSDGDGNARTLAFIQNFLPSIKSSDEQEQRLHLAASSAWLWSNWELKAIRGGWNTTFR